MIEKGAEERNTQLDGLRGLAAVAVAVFHTVLEMDASFIPKIVYGKLSALAGPYDWASKIILKIFSGETAVFIFFVLSGTVLFQSLMRDRSSIASVAPKFAIKRALRIYPALIVCLIVQVAVWAVLGRPVSVEGVLINATLYAFPVNGVTWTLNVEMVAVAFVLAVYLGWRTAGVAGMALAVAASWVLLQIPNLPLALTFKGFWVYFALGILIPTRVGRLISELVPSVAIVPILLMVIVFKSTLQQIAIALLVTMIFYNRAGSFGRLLETPAAQFLGRISYSFYLYNFMVFVLICEHVKKWKITVEHPLEVGLVASIATVAATIPLAYLSVWLVENPAIRLGRALTTDRSRMRSRAAAVRS